MKNLLLLHGAIGAQDQLQGLAKSLKENYRVFTMNFSGHGGRKFPESAFSIQKFAEEVLDFMHENLIEQTHIFGYSMGGYVGCYLAKHFPGKVEKLVTLATKFHWNEAIAKKEIQMIDPEKIETKLPAFAEALRIRHAPNDWKVLLAKTAEMLVNLGADNAWQPEDYTTIAHPVLLLIGDRDKMITLEETIEVYKAMPHAQMGMIPGSAHPLEQTNTHLLLCMIDQFLRDGAKH